MSVILLLASIGLAAPAALPEVTVRWSRDVARVTLTPPPGEHIEPDAPVSGWLAVQDGGRYQIATDGLGLRQGLMVAVPGADRTLSSAMRVSMCTDQGNVCHMVDLGFDATLPGRRGEARITPFVPKPGERADAARPRPLPLDEALARAAREDKRVLVDFAAVWCPPCNLLAAQVLEDPSNAPDLSGFVVARVDADAFDSWGVKSRYQVGGYPTVLVVDSTGAEIGRVVGYTSEAEFLGWLSGLSKVAAPLPAPASTSPAEALALAKRLVQAGQEEQAQAYLSRLGPADLAALAGNPDLNLVRFLVKPDRALALELLKAGTPVEQWMYPALDLAKADPELGAALRAAVEGAMAHAAPLQAADLLDVDANLAEAGDPQSARVMRLSAALLVEAAIAADPTLARGYTSALADLYASAGALDRTQQVLVAAMAQWPDEFTWPYALASALLDAGRPAEALEYALAAQTASYGDNRLRAVNLVARVLAALGRQREALTLIDETLASAPPPAADLMVRTHRYLATLQETRATVEASLKPK